MKGIKSTYLRLNIARKLLLGYLSLAVLIIVISVFALSSLERINKINRSVLKTYVPLIDVTDKMIDSLLAQELYAHRYAILRSPDMLGLFWQRSEEFNEIVKGISTLPDTKDVPVEALSSLHEEYNSTFSEAIKSLKKKSTVFSNEHEAAIKKKQKEMIGMINKISEDARDHQKRSAQLTSSIGSTAFRVTAILCVVGIVLGIAAATAITRNISGSINQLKLATEKISEGRFDDTPEVNNEDELGELSNSFKKMAGRLKRLEEMYLDASPLTRLPGGVAIENVLKKRIERGAPLAFCLVDMDNFKAYSDYYGYARGSSLIVEVSRIVEHGVRENGSEDDFIGHIGGDDFVIITTPQRFPAICGYIIEEFDRKVPEFYAEVDRERGYIVSKSRQGEVMKFPITSLSIAVVTNQNHNQLNHILVGEIAAELKEHAKSIPGSLYVVDQRREESLHVKENPKIIRFPKT
ncbi:MAG: HAMP domain-containing protein [Thermodesulfovibrionales bacterium]